MFVASILTIFRLTLRSPRERWQSLGKRSGEVGVGLEGTSTPMAAVFMLPLLGRAAAGGKEERGNRHASEDGPMRDGVRKKVTHFSFAFNKFLLQHYICIRDRGET